MELFRCLFYGVREGLLEKEKQYWLRLNTLYVDLKDIIRKICGFQHVYILSTKKSGFVWEILQANNISWNPDRIIDSGK